MEGNEDDHDVEATESEITQNGSTNNDTSYDEEASSRLQLQDLIEELQNHRTELADPHSASLDKHMEQLSEIFTQIQRETPSHDRTRKVTTITQACLDFKAFSLMASINHERIKAITASSWVFRPADFAAKLMLIAHEDRTSILRNNARMTDAGKYKLLEVITPFMQKLTTPWRPMLGTFDIDDEEIAAAAERRQRQPRNIASQQARNGQQLRPVSVSNAQAQQAEISVEDQILNVKRLLRHYITSSKRPVPYYKFIVNPESFARTVENVFYVSFLIKDGEVSLLEDEHGLPVLDLTDKSRNADNDSQVEHESSEEKKQIIINMTMDFWEELIEVLQVKTAMIRPCGNVRTRS